MSGFLGMFGKKSEIPTPPSGMKPPAPRPPGIGAPPPIADFPSSIMGLKAPKPLGNKVAKSTQRIVLPAQKTGPLLPPSLRPAPPGSQNAIEPTMRIMIPGKIEGATAKLQEDFNTKSQSQDKVLLPMSIAYRSLPPAVLSDQAQEIAGASEEFSIPMDLVVPQLSVGKIEFTVRQMIEFLPSTLFKSPEEISSLMEVKVVLPMMEVFTRLSTQKNKLKEAISAPIIQTPIIPDKGKTRILDLPVPTPSAPLIPEAIPPTAPMGENNLESLLAAAQCALGDEETGEKTFENPPSVDLIIEESPRVVEVIPPPPFVAQIAPSVSQSPSVPLEELLEAAQEALKDLPVGEQTLVVPELQEDKIDIQEPISEKIESSTPIEAVSTPPLIPSVTVPVPVPAVKSEAQVLTPEVSSEVELDLNRCDEALLMKSIHCSQEMARSIISYRLQSGGFSKVESLLLVPGMTDRVYRSITGSHASIGTLVGIHELLNITSELKWTIEQVVARVALWPGLRGCVVKQEKTVTGSLVGVSHLEEFIAQAEACLSTANGLTASEGLMHQFILKDKAGFWIFMKRGTTLLVSGFQGGMIPDSMRFVLEKLIIELHEPT